MNGSRNDAARTIGLPDVLRALPGLLPDAPTMAADGIKALSLSGETTDSAGHVFQRLAARHPNRPFLRFGAQEWTYGEANARVNQYAAALTDLGVGHGSVVGLLATNRPETLLVALATVKLGAVAGMLNHRQRGDVLDHSQKLLDSTVIVVGPECSDALDSLPTDGIRGTVVGLGPLGEHPDLDAIADTAVTTDPPQCARIKAGAKAFYIFTSGTTGMPKASSMSHQRWLKAKSWFGGLGLRLRPRDTLYCCLPLYHNNAITVSLSSVLAAGATLAIGESFSTSRFWDDVARAGATAFTYIGDICRYLLNQPHRDADRAHQVRKVIGNGLTPEIWSEFKQRFGIDQVVEFYASSEGNAAFINSLNLDATVGMYPLPHAVVKCDPEAGTPLRGPDGRLGEVPVGETGLLLTKVTDRVPFDGYTDAEASEAKLVRDAFRSGDVWFNTGDLVRRQGFRHIVFADRLGDTFRWKGENVATSEVEAAIDEHPGVEQSAVYGVAVPGAGGKAGMAAIKLADGHAFDGASLAEFLNRRLPGYAVPLFVRVVDELARTTTYKVQKTQLRDEGYDTDRITGPVYVLGDGAAEYVPAYPEYPQQVASGAIKV